MGKRKRLPQDEGSVNEAMHKNPALKDSATSHSKSATIQMITGSYDRVLHGMTATISPGSEGLNTTLPDVQFADTFLLNAHRSAIRCLALSPPSLSKYATDSQKIVLASGSSDERINLYHISVIAPSQSASKPSVPELSSTIVNENPKNRELGVLLHHSSSINTIYFPTRSKFLSAADDNTIAISRTRDWTVLSTIKIPIPKAIGRPSGDTAPPGGTPAGVNDFAVHPSMKLMISVGKGEKCMRLWNLVTGKKAGVLNFERDLLQKIGEGKWGSGEGRKAAWNSSGDEFVIGFEKGAVVFGMDSRPKCCAMASPVSKLHQIRYFPRDTADGGQSDVLAISTEDGRILFYSTEVDETSAAGVPACRILGQLGGKLASVVGRIKDFEILRLPATDGKEEGPIIIVITAGSDGSVRVWKVSDYEFDLEPSSAELADADSVNGEPIKNGKVEKNSMEDSEEPSKNQIGVLLGTQETGHRITCLKAFVMINPPESEMKKGDAEKWEDEFNGIESNDDE